MDSCAASSVCSLFENDRQGEVLHFADSNFELPFLNFNSSFFLPVLAEPNGVFLVCKAFKDELDISVPTFVCPLKVNLFSVLEKVTRDLIIVVPVYAGPLD
jgi:hypothetical protein